MAETGGTSTVRGYAGCEMEKTRTRIRTLAFLFLVTFPCGILSLWANPTCHVFISCLNVC